MIFYSDIAVYSGLTIGVDDTGHDVKFFGATSGKYMLWDESDDRLLLADNTIIALGTDSDMQIYHTTSGNNSYIVNYTGSLIIQNSTNDDDIIFKCDDGSGGNTAYLTLDGSNTRTLVHQHLNLEDSVILQIGNSQDLKLYHSGTSSFISQEGVGDLYIRNIIDDKDIYFQSDDGAGGTATYFYLDGSAANGTNTFTTWGDQSVIALGASNDLKLWHNGTNSYIKNEVGSFNIVQALDDGDLVLKCDNGSGGTTAYLTLDGSAHTIEVAKHTNFAGNVDIDGTTNLDVVDIDGAVNIALNILPGSDPFVEGQLWRSEEGYLLVSAGEGG